MANETIRFSPQRGSVTLELSTGYATLGHLLLAGAKDGSDFEEFGRGRLSDNAGDIFQIPAQADELRDYTVLLAGKYMPAPDHSQIDVTYAFVQEEEVIHRTHIQEEATKDIMRFHHYFRSAAAVGASP